MYVLSFGVDSDWRSLTSDPLGRASCVGVIASTERPNLGPEHPVDGCTWPTYSSLSICSWCRNITERMNDVQHCSSDGGLASLRCDLGLEGQSAVNINFGYSINDPVTYFNASASVRGHPGGS
jgi:hypothetical protein